MDIHNARVLLTGATGGLGGAFAESLAARGAQLILSGRRADELTALAERLDAQALPADLAVPGAAEELIDRVGRVDVVIANAGLPASGPVLDYSTTEIDRALEVNLRGPILLAKSAAAQMKERRQGHLVFMSSLSGKSAGANTALYNATKFGIRGFALGLREDLRAHGIGVSVIYPGPIRDTGMIADADVRLPRIGTTTSSAVVGATIRAIERNRGETTVAPWGLRAATLLGAVAPETAARLARVSGSDRIVAQISDGQRTKR